jgi:hypothetical protein
MVGPCQGLRKKGTVDPFFGGTGEAIIFLFLDKLYGYIDD